jgi:hypothetical protein
VEIPTLPEVKYGPLGISKQARVSIGEGMKTSFLMGVGHGFNTGYSTGRAVGHVTGVTEGVVIGSVCTGSGIFTLFLVMAVIARMLRK